MNNHDILFTALHFWYEDFLFAEQETYYIFVTYVMLLVVL